jgi:hypothetical protein
MKKVTFTPKPVMPVPASVDAWVKDRHGSAEPTKRFTVDVPLSLHRRVKSQCALRSVRMTDMLRELLEREFPEERQEARGGGESAH